ncbi:MAG TPA: hypothetical protein VHM70_00285 [Polyangiaceae bacterium]|jgi:hypothetical protein|nr:hypothetical protein [Polyangiaceae bacterium]
MPLTLTLTEGVLPKGTEGVTFAQLCEAMLKWHGLSGNRAMIPNVVGTIQVLPKSETYSGMNQTPVVFIEWKVPSFAFTDRKVQLGYIEEATNIIHEASGRRQPKEHIWCNVVHAVDGAWGVNGQALTNAQLAQDVSRAQ